MINRKICDLFISKYIYFTLNIYFAILLIFFKLKILLKTNSNNKKNLLKIIHFNNQ
jgi:hypothetical protein